jgi:hypothetical protein
LNRDEVDSFNITQAALSALRSPFLSFDFVRQQVPQRSLFSFALVVLP